MLGNSIVKHGPKPDIGWYGNWGMAIFGFFCFFLLGTYTSSAQKKSNPKGTQDYYVAAYVWPSCHDEPMSREKLWGEGTGEWEIIQKGNPRFEGHYQPRVLDFKRPNYLKIDGTNIKLL